MLLPDRKEEATRDKRKYKTVKYNIDSKSKNKYKGKTFYLKTYGCQMNERDSETLVAMLKQLGFKEEKDYRKADFLLLNTCSIRENAHNKAFGMLGRFKHLKQTRPEIVIGLCGCMAQETSVCEELLKNYKFVNLVFGTHNLDKLPILVDKAFSSDERQIEVYSREQDLVEDLPVIRSNKYKAYVNIIYGCDKFCTYCIVPYTRGKQRSRKKEDIINEVKDLKEKGYKEITLLGQNVNAYGKDIYDDYNLANLLSDVSDTGIDRVRFVTSHPWDFTDEMVDIIASRDNIMPYIHLPLQSGSDRILKLMNRRYTSEEYLKLYNQIRSKVKDSSITTDIIVGFPGETEEDFQKTLDLVNKCKFDGAFTFAFSPRENTPAALMKQTVSEEEKMDRLHRLNEVVNKYSNEANKKLMNKIVKCLVIGESDKDNTKVCGYTENMKLVNIEGPHSIIGKIVNVEITDTKSFSLDGKYVDNI